GPLRVAQLPVADERDPGPLEQGAGLGAEHQVEVVDPAGPRVADGPQLGGVDGRVHVDLGDAGWQVVDGPLDRLPGPDARGVQEPVGEEDTLLGGQVAEGEADGPWGGGAGESDGQAVVDGEVEVDVEELRPQLHDAHVAVEVAHVEAPQDRPLDL